MEDSTYILLTHARCMPRSFKTHVKSVVRLISSLIVLGLITSQTFTTLLTDHNTSHRLDLVCRSFIYIHAGIPFFLLSMNWRSRYIWKSLDYDVKHNFFSPHHFVFWKIWTSFVDIDGLLTFSNRKLCKILLHTFKIFGLHVQSYFYHTPSIQCNRYQLWTECNVSKKKCIIIKIQK